MIIKQEYRSIRLNKSLDTLGKWRTVESCINILNTSRVTQCVTPTTDFGQVLIVWFNFLQQSVEHLQRLFEKFVPKVLDFRSHHCKELIPTSELNSVVSLCVLFDALATEENGVSDNI